MTTALVLGDQLMRDNPALEGADRVLLVQSRALLKRRGLHRRRARIARTRATASASTASNSSSPTSS